MIASGDLARTISCFGETLASAFSTHPNVRQVRQRGLTAAVELVPDAAQADTFPIALRAGMQVTLAAREHGLLLRPLGDTLLLVPPICISPKEISLLTERTLAAMNQALPKLT